MLFRCSVSRAGQVNPQVWFRFHSVARRQRALCALSGRDRLRCVATAASTSGSWRYLKEFSVSQFKGTSQRYLESDSARLKLRQHILDAYQTPNPEVAWCPASPSGSPSTASHDKELNIQPGTGVMMGICASQATLAVKALQSWCSTLGVEFIAPESKVSSAASWSEVQGPVYLKYNSKSMVCYISSYQGRERGVLLQLGQQQFGYFPLGLFSDE